MKTKEHFILRQVADTWVVMALGDATIDFTGMLTLNDSGAMLWKALEQGADYEELTERLISEYEVTWEHARKDVNAFVEKLINAGCIDLEND